MTDIPPGVTDLAAVRHDRQVSRTSAYANAPVAYAQQRLLSQGVNPADVSLACALDRHGECDGTIDKPRRRGAPAALCQCPDCITAKVASHLPAVTTATDPASGMDVYQGRGGRQPRE